MADINGFEKHNIDHSSASSINMYCNAPDAWAARYLFNRKFSFGLAARAGVLAEDAVVNVLANGWTADKAIEEALKAYNKAAAINATPAELKRGEAIAGMIELALGALAEYGEPEFGTDLVHGKKQVKVELICNGDGWQLPVIGYLDFWFLVEGRPEAFSTQQVRSNSMMDRHLRS